MISYINDALPHIKFDHCRIIHIILVHSEDVEGRMEQGKLSIHIRVAEEEKEAADDSVV